MRVTWQYNNEGANLLDTLPAEYGTDKLLLLAINALACCWGDDCADLVDDGIRCSCCNSVTELDGEGTWICGICNGDGGVKNWPLGKAPVGEGGGNSWTNSWNSWLSELMSIASLHISWWNFFWPTDWNGWKKPLANVAIAVVWPSCGL